MKIRTLIVDDMLLARNRVRRHLEQDPEIEIVGEASGGQAAIDDILALQPDLVFLDVQMPEVGGFEVLEAVGVERVPAVIFVTAFDQFALKAFEMHALDYLLKPFDAARLAAAVARAKRQVRQRGTEGIAGRLQALLSELGAGAAQPRRLAIKADGRTVFLPVDDIDYVEAAGNYIRIQAGAESHMIRDRISEMEARLDAAGFVRIHRSTLVNASRIRELHPLFNGDQTVVLQGGKKLTMSRTYREAVLAALNRD
jgi:two-component system LytT family response regulator